VLSCWSGTQDAALFLDRGTRRAVSAEDNLVWYKNHRKQYYNGVPKKPVSEIVILVSSLRKLRMKGIPFVFSDRHAYLKTALFSDDLADLSRIVWPVLQERNFRRDDLDRFEKYQAEALVHLHDPLGALSGIVCYNQAVKASAQAEIDEKGLDLKVVVQSEWYL
jgi:hypothetical protein